jgi:mono/diheme cytochrome c family protein
MNGFQQRRHTLKAGEAGRWAPGLTCVKDRRVTQREDELMRTLLIPVLILSIGGCNSSPPANATPPVAGQSPASVAEIETGKRIVELQCVSCHAVRGADASRNPKAPPLRKLAERYPVAGLADAFALGIMTGHPDMPQFRLTRAQVAAIVAYLESIQTRQGAALEGTTTPTQDVTPAGGFALNAGANGHGLY